jgi:hypothetical protein
MSLSVESTEQEVDFFLQIFTKLVAVISPDHRLETA